MLPDETQAKLDALNNKAGNGKRLIIGSTSDSNNSRPGTGTRSPGPGGSGDSSPSGNTGTGRGDSEQYSTGTSVRLSTHGTGERGGAGTPEPPRVISGTTAENRDSTSDDSGTIGDGHNSSRRTDTGGRTNSARDGGGNRTSEARTAEQKPVRPYVINPITLDRLIIGSDTPEVVQVPPPSSSGKRPGRPAGSRVIDGKLIMPEGGPETATNAPRERSKALKTAGIPEPTINLALQSLFALVSIATKHEHWVRSEDECAVVSMPLHRISKTWKPEKLEQVQKYQDYAFLLSGAAILVGPSLTQELQGNNASTPAPKVNTNVTDNTRYETEPLGFQNLNRSFGGKSQTRNGTK